MKQITVMALAIACLAMACTQHERKEEQANTRDQSDKTPAQQEKPALNGMPEPAPPAPEQRKLAHKSQVNFEVAQTMRATQQIEDRVSRSGGFILQSHVTMNGQKTKTEATSADSLKKITYYQLQNEMVVRVPDSALNGFLNFVESLSRFTTSRITDAEDLSLSLTAAQLEAARLNRQLSRRANAPIAVEGQPVALEEKEGEKDAALMNRLNMKDAVQFSTVALSFRQPPQINIQYEINADAVWARQPGFSSRAGDAFSEGWDRCKDLLVFFMQIWWLLLLAAAGVFVYKKWGRQLLAAPKRGRLNDTIQMPKNTKG